MTFFTTMTLALFSLFGALIFTVNNFMIGWNYEADELDKTQGTTIPVVRPGQSAPAEAVRACNIKQVDDACSFTLSNTDLEGICTDSGGELACTPVSAE